MTWRRDGAALCASAPGAATSVPQGHVILMFFPLGINPGFLASLFFAFWPILQSLDKAVDFLSTSGCHPTVV